MDDADFRKMVAAYEHSCRHEPRRFAAVTATFAALGYALIVGALVLAAVLLVWAVVRLATGRFSLGVLLLVVTCASLLWSLVGALWSRQHVPEGLEVTRADAPFLFELIDTVRHKCGAAPPDVVLLDGELNAAIVQQPRLGLLGWHRNTLILGLPMLLALSAKQLAAVIAHEFGHLRGAHGKLGAWVYRTRRSWWLLAQSRVHSRLGAWWADAALGIFFEHFFPRFNARAFVLSRRQEYEADAMAHRVAGAQAAAEGLLSMSVQGRFLSEHFWPDVYATAAMTATPKVAPYRAMRKRIPEALVHPGATGWLREALKRLPSENDTHPSLRERLGFADVKPALPAPVEKSAAEQLLRSTLPGWIERLDESWKTRIAERWAEMHREFQLQRQWIEELKAERKHAVLNADEHLLWARTAGRLDGPQAAVAVLRALLADHPGHMQARLELAMHLADSQDLAAQDEGADLLRELAEASGHEFAAVAARRYETWLESHERFNDLKPWRELARTLEMEADRAWEALHEFHGKQSFESPRFGKRILRPAYEVLRSEPAVERAFLVRKTTAAAAGWRFCMLVVERKRFGFGLSGPNRFWDRLREQAQLPCAFMLVDLSHPFWRDPANEPLVRQIVGTPDACIYAGRAAA